MLTSIRFEKLFNRFDYCVELKQGGLTIITGPNGFGKSTILRSIEALSKGIVGLIYFERLDFKKITASFDKGTAITIEKTDESVSINGIKYTTSSIRNITEKNHGRRQLYIKTEDDEWISTRDGRPLTYNEYVDELYNKGLLDPDKMVLDSAYNEELISILRMMKQLTDDIFFVQEQRLIKEKYNRYGEQKTINAIEELPNRLKELMSKVQQDYSIVASKLDSTYPNRLFETQAGITEAQYNIKMQEMAAKFERMSQYDLSAMKKPGKLQFNEEHAKALKVYFDDFEKKYKAYEDFINKLDLYTDIINQKLKFKSIKISMGSGISVIDDNGKELELSQLSSGEKQEIVLFYDLIFVTQKNVLLLIDEPEISLHITWQKKFMDDLLKIIEYKGFNVIVATHSPQILNNHWDLQIDLGELYGNKFN